MLRKFDNVALLVLICLFVPCQISSSSFTVSNNNDSGPGSLRQAILNANNNEGPDVVKFLIPGPTPHTIALRTMLPGINDTISLDATTQPGADPIGIILTSNSLLQTGLNLTLGSSNSVIRGFSINNFANNCVMLYESSNNIISTNYLGWDINNNQKSGCGYGIHLNTYCTNNTIGGLNSFNRNVISGNGVAIGIENQSQGNSIMSNYIGTDPAGMSSIPNKVAGIIIDNSDNNTVGGARTGNIISGNSQLNKVVNAIWIRNRAESNRILGNLIGINSAGNKSLPNGIGILIDSASNNLIGDDNGGKNVISGNGIGLRVYNSFANIIKGNYIGTGLNGITDMGNNSGIALFYGNNNTIGSTTLAGKNIISGNGYGLNIQLSNGNLITGNYIGVDITGNTALSNGNGGIILGRSSYNLIDANLISGNQADSFFSAHGIFLSDSSTNNCITNNLIGTNASGNLPIPNDAGILLDNSNNNIIGDISGNTTNVISGNLEAGVEIENSQDNRIVGNIIGADITMSKSIPNRQGIRIFQSVNNTVGGLGFHQGNTVAYNAQQGIIIGNSTSDMTAQGNGILSNNIFNNGEIGIDLGNFSLPLDNHKGSPSKGPNHFQNYPIIDQVVIENQGTLVNGTLNSVPNSQFIIQFFANQRNVTDITEGEKFLGNVQVQTDSMGFCRFEDVKLPLVDKNSFISATATVFNNNIPGDSSEFSPNAMIESLMKKIVKIKELLGNV